MISTPAFSSAGLTELFISCPSVQFTNTKPAKMLLKAHTILWICISIQCLQDMDFAVDFVKMKNPFNSKEDVPKYGEGNQGGVQRRLEPGEDETKEETSVHLHPKMGFVTSQVSPKPWLTDWSGKLKWCSYWLKMSL